MSDIELFVDFLKCVVESIGNLNRIESDRQKIGEKLKQKYQQIEKLNKKNDFYKFLKQEYGDERDIYLTLLHYICEMTCSIRPWVEFLKEKLEQEFEEENDLFVELNLWEQIRSQLFREGQRLPFMEQWKINERMAANMVKTFSFSYEKIKKSDRDNNFVVLIVQTLLSVGHAPTKIAVEIARAIQEYLKKRVLIISAVLTSDEDLLAKRGMEGYFLDTNRTDHRGAFQIEYKEEYIDTYQILIEKNNRSEIKKLMDELYRLKPFCVWNLAAEPVFSTVAKQWTTSIYTLMCQGYPPVDADYIVHYIPSDNQEDKANKEFLRKKNIEVIETEFLFPYDKPQKNLQREDFGMPDRESFCIGIVGTRLFNECTNEFLKMLDRTVSKDKGIFVLFLGFGDEDIKRFEERLNETAKNLLNYKLMEYKDDMIEYLTFIDIFVNPPRIGGGNCGAMAMSLGIPVITLKTGDVAAVAGEDYTADALEEYTDLILKYKYDQEFYNRQSESAVKRIEDQTMDDAGFASVIQNIFDEIA